MTPLRRPVVSLLPLLGVAATVVILYVARRRFPGGLAAWIHMAIVVAPVSGLLHSGIQLGADRYSYQADLGFALLVGYALTWAFLVHDAGRLSAGMARLMGGVAGIVVLALAAGSSFAQATGGVDVSAATNGLQAVADAVQDIGPLMVTAVAGGIVFKWVIAYLI